MVIQASDILLLRAADQYRSFRAEEIPKDDSAAYRLSLECIDGISENIAAWKLGGSTAITRAAFNTEKIYFGAMVESEVYHPPHVGSLCVKLPLRGEAEIALRLACDITDEILEHPVSADIFDAYAPVIECPWSVVADLPQAGLRALLMDRCASGELLLTASRPYDPAALDGVLEIVADNTVLTSGRSSASLLMSPESAAIEALGAMLANGYRPTAGHWIATGGITACVPLPLGTPFSLLYDGVVVGEFMAKASS